MDAIDVPIKIWNQYIDLKNGDQIPLKIKSELFEKGFPIRNGLIGTTELNSIMTFTGDNPGMYPLVAFSLEGDFTEIIIGLYEEKWGDNQCLFECKNISITPKVKKSVGYFDFDVNWCDDYFLNDKGVVDAHMCDFLRKCVFLILGIQTSFAVSKKNEVYIEGNELEKRHKTKHKKQAGISVVRIGNITITHYGRKNNSYERVAESWNVRGHWRHYKNGHSIFIQPYQKGAGKLNPKIYKMGNEGGE